MLIHENGFWHDEGLQFFLSFQIMGSYEIVTNQQQFFGSFFDIPSFCVILQDCKILQRQLHKLKPLKQHHKRYTSPYRCPQRSVDSYRFDQIKTVRSSKPLARKISQSSQDSRYIVKTPVGFTRCCKNTMVIEHSESFANKVSKSRIANNLTLSCTTSSNFVESWWS